MNCPTCAAESRVLETRTSGRSMRRRRECRTCRMKFTTMEIVVSTDRQWSNAAVIILPHKVARELRAAMEEMVEAFDRVDPSKPDPALPSAAKDE